MENIWINQKHKTCLYAAYKRVTSEERAYTDWNVRDGNFFFMQIKMKRRENGVAIFILDKIDFVFPKIFFLLILPFFFPFIFISWRLITLQYCSVFAIHWHESAMDLHVLPILIPPPTSLSTRFLWVFPVHQAQALVSSASIFKN